MLKSAVVILASLAMLAPAFAGKEQNGNSARRLSNGELMFKRYPARALAAGEQGQVGFTVTIRRDGTLADCLVTKTSGFSALDKETCNLVTQYAEFPRTRDANGNRAQVVHHGVVNWKIPGGSTAPSSDAPKKRSASYDPEKIVCKSEVKTGSLVARERRCMTLKQWARGSDNTRNDIRRQRDNMATWDPDPK